MGVAVLHQNHGCPILPIPDFQAKLLMVVNVASHRARMATRVQQSWFSGTTVSSVESPSHLLRHGRQTRDRAGRTETMGNPPLYVGRLAASNWNHLMHMTWPVAFRVHLTD